MRQLTRAGVRFVVSGFGRDMAEQTVILERRGWRVAFFALTRAWNPAPYTFRSHAGSRYVAWGDTDRIYPAIREVKASGRADLVVVSMHGGTEYADAPPKHMQELARGGRQRAPPPSRASFAHTGSPPMTRDTMDFLKRLLDTPGPSGFETAPARVWRDEVKTFADQVSGDVHGNSVAAVNPKGVPRLM